MMFRPILAGILSCIVMAAPIARSQEVTLAAAADLTYCVPQLNAAFEKANPGAAVKAAFGSSGNFYQEIRNGAPFDLFMSADMQYPQKLAQEGFASQPVEYAAGRLVLWSMSLDVSRGLAILSDPAVKHIAVANPDHAPYGRAAKAALEKTGLWDELAPKLVFGESVGQTAQFVRTGNAEAGLVAMSLVVGPGKPVELKPSPLTPPGDYPPLKPNFGSGSVVVVGPAQRAGHFYEVPAGDYPALDQGVVVTKAGAGKPLAQAYVTFLQSEEARKIFGQYGFRLPK